MFALCASMRWNHLPVAGGIYDQDPGLMRKFEVIFGAINRHEKAEAEKRDREAKNQQKKASARGPRPRMRAGGMRRRR